MQEIKQAISHVEGTAIVVPGNDIDTDQIIPARFMKVVTFDGLGEYAFYDLRFTADGQQKPHPFNEERFSGASVLVVNRNFGCGSSREHAPQALMRAGIKAMVGESFAEIFAGNCTAMGVPAITLPHGSVQKVMQEIEDDPLIHITIDLPSSVITVGDASYTFDMPAAYRSALIAGNWDSTSVLLSHLDMIDNRASKIPYISGFAV
ncbi:MAG: 3-isopropylmalate dehydratase small subunit [Alkalispirochaeta sp.]